MNKTWKYINIIGDILLIGWSFIMIVNGKGTFHDYITLYGALTLGLLDFIRNIINNR